MLRFPVVVKTRDGNSPEEEEARKSNIHYVVAANGVFQVRELATHRSVTRVSNSLPGLPDEFESLELRVPRLPRALLEDTLAFFNEVYVRYGGEAIVVPFYQPHTREYQIGVPPQRISSYVDYYGKRWCSSYLDYEGVALPKGHVRLGTIHSHAALGAQASHTDCHDERFEDGLHVIFGSFKSLELSRSASFVAGGCRFTLEPDSVLEPAAVPDRSPPADWMDRVEYVEEHSKAYSSRSAATTHTWPAETEYDQ
jgi:hypothetical protein